MMNAIATLTIVCLAAALIPGASAQACHEPKTYWNAALQDGGVHANVVVLDCAMTPVGFWSDGYPGY